MITDTSVEKSIHEIAYYITCRGLQTPAIFALEMLRPFAGSFLLTAEALSPLFFAALGQERSRRLFDLLSDRGAIDVLLALIDDSRGAEERLHG